MNLTLVKHVPRTIPLLLDPVSFSQDLNIAKGMFDNGLQQSSTFPLCLKGRHEPVWWGDEVG